MAPRLSTEELAAALGRQLGGTVEGLRRLSGGASRVTSAFDLRTPDGGVRPLILQMDRGGSAPRGRARMEADLLRAAGAAGVPVPGVVALGERDELGASWLVVDRLEGETIPRKLLRDDEWAGARARPDRPGGPRAGRHPHHRPGLHQRPAAGGPARRPAALPRCAGRGAPRARARRALAGALTARPERPGDRAGVAVHGDYRMGNFLVGPDGLRGVLDWELAHTGDPAEDIGWLCAPAWRFGGSGEVGGFGALPELLAAYADAGGEAVTPARVHWWQVYATVKWATICALQASAHLSGATRSVELAAIGRRVCESEWDLFTLLGTPPPAGRRTGPRRTHRRPPSAGRPRPSWSRPCASTSRASWSAARAVPASRRAWRATRWASPSASSGSARPSPPRTAERLADARLRRRRRAGRRAALGCARRRVGVGGAGARRVGA